MIFLNKIVTHHELKCQNTMDNGNMSEKHRIEYNKLMMYTKIAILSDTHSLLRPEVEKVLRGCDRILHAGDIASKETYDKIGDIAPTVFVRGNADKAWAEEIPAEAEDGHGSHWLIEKN